MGLKVAPAAVIGLLSLLSACSGGTTTTAGAPASPESDAAASSATSQAPPAPVGGAECPVGDYQVNRITGKSGADVNGVPVTASSGGGFTLALAADGTWKLSGTNAAVTLQAAGLTVDATVNGTAEGDYAKVGATYAFHQKRATGKVTLKKPVGGVSSWSMDQVGPALAPGGQATLTCGPGTLALESESVVLDLTSTGGAPNPPATGGGSTGGGSSEGTSGGALTLTESSVTRTVDCAGRDVAITGSTNKLTLTGSCGTVSIKGSKNEVVVAKAGQISVTGSFNKVTWSSGNPKTSNNGTGNTISQG